MKTIIKLLSLVTFLAVISSAAFATPELTYGVQLSLDKHTVMVREYTMPPESVPSVQVDFRIFNRSEDPLAIVFEDSCMFDLVIRNSEREIVRDIKATTLCTMEIVNRTISLEQEVVFSESLQLVNDDQVVLPHGNYTVEVTTRSTPRYSANIGLHITNELGE